MATETLPFGQRRGAYVDVSAIQPPAAPLPTPQREAFESLDTLYRSLCAILYNYVPVSGHPGGSISSGRIGAGVVFDALDYDVSRPDREDADVLSYAAGHKAMGLYALWALRDEIARLGAPELVPDMPYRLRLEDLHRLPPQPGDADSPVLPQAGQGPGRTSHAGHAVREAGHRRLRRGRGQLDRPGPGRPRLLRSRRSARPHRRGRGRAHSRPRLRGAGGGGHRLPRQRRPPRRLEPGLHRQRPRVCGGRPAGRLRAVEPRRAVPAPRLERGLRRRRHGPGPGDRRPADRRRPPHGSAHGRRLPHGQGLALRDRGTRLPRSGAQARAPRASTARSPSWSARAT